MSVIRGGQTIHFRSTCTRLAAVVAVPLIVGALTACEKTIPVEPDAKLSGFAKATANNVAKYLYLAGWPCDSVSYLNMRMIREDGPRDLDAAWTVSCNNGQHAYIVVEHVKGATISLDIQATTDGTTRGDDRTPGLLEQGLKLLWVGLTEDHWLLGPFLLAIAVPCALGSILFSRISRRRRNRSP